MPLLLLPVTGRQANSKVRSDARTDMPAAATPHMAMNRSNELSNPVKQFCAELFFWACKESCFNDEADSQKLSS